MPADWPPPIPPRLRKRLAIFTFYARGVAIWYQGRTRHVCGRIALDQIEQKWQEKKRSIDRNAAKPTIAAGASVVSVADAFLRWLDHRVETAQPKPLARATRDDYERTLTRFGRLRHADTRIAELPISELGPDSFGVFAKHLASLSAVSFARHAAYLRSFVRFAHREGFIDRLPQWGSYLGRSTHQQAQDDRLAQRKAFSPAEIQRLFFHASIEEKCWLLLGINGALDNSDLCNLTWGVIDRGASIIDYRRRKVGRQPRVIPIWPITLDVLAMYRRPAPLDPADANRVFLTPTGLPLAREVRSAAGRPHRIDYVAMQWTRLMRRAGIATGGGRGFRSLRTSFPNLAPARSRAEVELIMGHAGGSVLLSNYLEDYGIDSLRTVVQAVFDRAFG